MILTYNPNLESVLIDISSNLGTMIKKENLHRVLLLPNHSIKQYLHSSKYRTAKYIIISDVLHHIAIKDREEFFNDLFSLCNRNTVLIIKDIEPGFFKSKLSLLSDKYISGDKNTNLISQRTVIEEIKKKYPQVKIKTNCVI